MANRLPPEVSPGFHAPFIESYSPGDLTVIPVSLEEKKKKKEGTFVMGVKELGQKIESHMVRPCFKWYAVSAR